MEELLFFYIYVDYTDFQFKPCISEISSAKDRSYYQKIFKGGHWKTWDQELWWDQMKLTSNQKYIEGQDGWIDPIR